MGLEELAKEMQQDCAKAMMKNQLEREKPVYEAALLNVENPFYETKQHALFERIRAMVRHMDGDFWQAVIDRISEKTALMEAGTTGRALFCEKMVLEFERKEQIYHAYCEILRHPRQMEERLVALKKELRKLDQKMASFPVIQGSLFEGEESR